VQPSVTVEEILQLPIMESTRVLAGAKGLDRLVQSVGVVAGTEIIEWVKSGAIVLSTGHPLSLRVDDLEELVDGLNDRNVACLAVRLGSYMTELPAAMLERADVLGLPIVQLTDRYAFDDIMVQVLRAINATILADIAFVEDTRAQLVRRYLTTASLVDVIAEIEEALSASVLVFDPRGDPSTFVPDYDAEPSVPPQELEDGARDPAVSGPGRSVVVLCLGTRASPLGYLQCRRHERPFTDGEVMALEQAATVVSLALMQRQAVREVESQYHEEILGRVIEGQPFDQAEMADRFRSLGWRLDAPMRVTAIAIWPKDIHTSVDCGRWLRSIALPTAQYELAQGAHGAVTAMAGQTLIVVGTGDHKAGVDRAVERILRLFDSRVSRRLNATITVGRSGGVPDLASLRRGHLQARVAAIAARQRTQVRVCTFEELGLLGLVMMASEGGDFDSLHDNVLSRLEELAPRERETSLSTLRTLIQTNFNLAETARLVHCHYNTVRYRVRRLEELLGPFTTDVRLRINIILNLQLLEFAAAPPGAGSEW
jgi:PucR family transcriptional regulator, purine catabolism regulatory protein